MSAPDSSDDFSLLPTADGGPPRKQPPLPAAPKRKQQTRIALSRPGEQPPEPEPAQAPETDGQHDAPALSEDWQELLQDTSFTEPDMGTWSTRPPESAPPAPAAPRRTVIGRRAPEPQPAEETATSQPSPQSTSPGPRRTVVGRKSPSAEPPVSAPLPPNADQDSSDSEPEAPQPAEEQQTAAPSGTESRPQTESPPDTSSKKEEPAAEKKAPSDDSGKTDDKPSSEAEASPAPGGAAATQPGAWHQRWDRWGGRALGVSLLVHLVLLGLGATFVVTQVMDPQTDFLPGGGTVQGAEASQDLEHKIQQKKSPWLKKPLPARKIAAVGSVSDIVLPDDVPDLLELPESRSLFSDSKITTGMGLSGAGGGLNKGMGLGSKSGMVFQPFSMFGMQIKAKRLALVLDVSTSMAPHLPRVIAEVDKVARGSVVVLYFGCGLEPPPPGGLEGDGVYSTSSTDFEKFWRLGGVTLTETRKFRINPANPIPDEAIFRVLSKRPQTYFIHNTGLGYTWLALLSDQVRNADGIYWFSDFQDRVEFKQATIVLENLQRRKQRLYMHAYVRGSSYDLVRSQIVEPTGGDVFLETE